MLMPNCSTVSAILAPSCAASMTRLRKSSEYGLAIRTGLHSSTILESDSSQKRNRPDSTFSEKRSKPRVICYRIYRTACTYTTVRDDGPFACCLFVDYPLFFDEP